MSVFSQNLSARLAELEISQAELARRLGLDPRRVGHYITGIREPDIATLAKIAKALEISADSLVGLLPQDTNSGELQRTRSQISAICSIMDRGQLLTLHSLAKALLKQQQTGLGKEPSASNRSGKKSRKKP